MSNKVSVFYDHILEAIEQTGLTRIQILRELKNSGADALEINYNHLKKNYKELMEELSEVDLGISCIYDTYDWGNKPIWINGKKLVDMAKKVGAEKILVIPGFISEKEADSLYSKSYSYEETTIFMNANPKVQNMKSALIKLIGYAKTKGIQVTMEDFDGRTAPFSCMYQLKWFMVNVPGLKCAFDTGNFAYSDEDVTKAYDILAPYIVHVHCKDRGVDPETAGKNANKGLLPVPCGKGYIPMKELIVKMKDSGYEGYLAAEHFFAPDQESAMNESIQYLCDLAE